MGVKGLMEVAVVRGGRLVFGALGLGLLFSSCSVSQYDYPVAAGAFPGELSTAVGAAGTLIVDVGRSTQIEGITVTIDATDTAPAALVTFDGPIEIGGFEARTFSAQVEHDAITWDITGAFAVHEGLEIDAEATLCSGDMTSSNGGSWHFEAIFDADGGSGDPLE